MVAGVKASNLVQPDARKLFLQGKTEFYVCSCHIVVPWKKDLYDIF